MAIHDLGLGNVIRSFFGLNRSGASRKTRRRVQNSHLGFEKLESRALLAVIHVGNINTQDGAVEVNVDGYGAFGRAWGRHSGDAYINRIGPGTAPQAMIFQSALAIGPIGTGGSAGRRFLFDRSTSSDPDVIVTVSSDGSTATSSFTLSFAENDPLAPLNGLSMYLTQVLVPVFEGKNPVGALLTQTYGLDTTNNDGVDLDLVRYMDSDIGVNATPDGGGRFIFDGDEWLFTTANDHPTVLNEPDLFVAIATQGGVVPTTNRYEVAPYNGGTLRSNIIGGNDLRDTVDNDTNPNDGFIDVGSTYDVTEALRTVYAVAPRGLTQIQTFTTYTLFADGVPTKILADNIYGAPRVRNVELDGTTWTGQQAYSFADIVPTGKQLAPIYTEGVNTIRISFSKDVILNGSAMTLYATYQNHSPRAISLIPQNELPAGQHPFDYDSASHVGTWRFRASDLVPDRYRIDIASSLVTDAAGHSLDGKWDNLTYSTLYDWTDDPTGRTLLSGDSGSGTGFQFLFALAPGDYNQDGMVNADDYDITQSFDGNGDGVVGGTADYTVWAMHDGDILFGTRNGDYGTPTTQDGRVNEFDYMVWRMSYGLAVSPNTLADGNGDGLVNNMDYRIWRTWRGNGVDAPPNSQVTVSAWYLSPNGAASVMAIQDSTSAPRVVNVTISGSNSTHNPYSFANHVGSGEQLRTVPVGGADTISITFSEEVNVEASYLRVVGLRTFNVPTLVEFSYDAATMTATWRFASLVENDHYLISLSDAVTNMQGYRLDGEWVNPVCLSEGTSYWGTGPVSVNYFPSGDGHAGGDFNFIFTLLGGDANLDDTVTSADYYIWSSHAYGPDGSFQLGDFNGDGAIDSADIAVWTQNAGADLTGLWMVGDLNFDGAVNDSDLAIVAQNQGLSNASWQDGDLNFDGHVNQSDFDCFRAVRDAVLARVKRVSERGTVPFCSEDCAKSGQSPTILLHAQNRPAPFSFLLFSRSPKIATQATGRQAPDIGCAANVISLRGRRTDNNVRPTNAGRQNYPHLIRSWLQCDRREPAVVARRLW